MTARGGSRTRLVVDLLAVVLALVVLAGAIGAFWLQQAERELTPDEVLLVRVANALAAQQGADGAFDPEPDAPDLPEVLKTFPHALATAALARTRALGLEAHVPDLGRRLDRALDVLASRQKPGGGFGGLPPSAGNRWPGVNAMAGAVLAFSTAGRPADREVLRGALAALERSAAYELRDGWTRGLVALAFHTARAVGAEALVGRDLASLLAVGDPDLRADCRDEQVAEALVRRVRGLPGGFPDAVVAACVAKEPVWLGERSDLQAWWMQAWLAARSTGGSAWFDLYREALDEALEVPPEGRIGGGWFADEITQTASAVLGLAEAVRPLGRGPFPGLPTAPTE